MNTLPLGIWRQGGLRKLRGIKSGSRAGKSGWEQDKKLRCFNAHCRATLAPFRDLLHKKEYEGTLLLMVGLLRSVELEPIFIDGLCDVLHFQLKVLSRCRHSHPGIVQSLPNRVLQAAHAGPVQGLSDFATARVSANLVPILDYCLKRLFSDSLEISSIPNVLSEIGEAAVMPLLTALKDERWRIRWVAIASLKHLGDQRTVEPLMRSLRDRDERVARTAAFSLAGVLERIESTGDLNAIPTLQRLLVHSNLWVRGAAKDTLKKIEIRTGSDIGTYYVRPLIMMLQDKDDFVCLHAHQALVEIRYDAVGPLITALRDGDENVRHKIPFVLARIGDLRAVEPLIAALKDMQWKVRMQAAEALGLIRDERAVRPHVETLSDENENVRCEAACALEKMDGAAVGQLIMALKDRNVEVQRAAAYALGKIGNPAVEPLLSALKERDFGIRWDAASILGRIRDVRAVKPLIVALRDEEIRWAAARSLGELSRSAVEPLKAVLVDSLKAVLIDPNDDIRSEVAYILGEIGYAQPVDVLEVLLRDPSETVREAAQWALKELEHRSER